MDQRSSALNTTWRTHTCGELRPRHKDQTVRLCGWVHRRRDHGKLIFIDVRDRYGITQVVFVPSVSRQAHERAQSLGPEFVVRVTGTVSVRPPKNVNPDLATGEIEVCATELEILNPSKVPVFEVESETPVAEDVRLAHRYLDLRRSSMQQTLLFRHRLIKAVSSFLDEAAFIEIETPVLTKSTPEGARDFLVPSRLMPGRFYALPQSPQLFKQILMVSGFDRYYQIVKCFRDEDLRADRQPEFTQLDLEMSFAGRDDVLDLMERLWTTVLTDLTGRTVARPFKRLSYREAMERYGTDKPDLRQGDDDLAFVWIVDFPLFKYNEDERRWESEHHPFTGVHPDDTQALSEGRLDGVRSMSYDLVLNGHEIGSGSVRIHQRDLQERIFQVIGLDETTVRERFGFLLEAFEFGAPPHAGIAFGLDRIVAVLTRKESIRDTIAFPKTQSGACLLSGAPSAVDQQQLKELGLAVTTRGGGHA